MFAVEDTHWWYVGLHELILGHVAREAARRGRPLRILDAGCGTGRLCQLMSAYGEVVGVDVSEDAIRHCHARGVNARVADLNLLELEPGAYDVITSIDVLYHAGITDDVFVMKKLGDALRPEGVLIVNLVAFECLRSTHDLAVHTRERYRRETVETRLRTAGFTDSNVTYRVGVLFPAIAVYRLLTRFLRRSVAAARIDSDVSLPPSPVNAVLLGAIRLENMLLRTIRLPVGSSVFAVAHKQ